MYKHKLCYKGNQLCSNMIKIFYRTNKHIIRVIYVQYFYINPLNQLQDKLNFNFKLKK